MPKAPVATVQEAARHFAAVTPDSDDDPGWCNDLALALTALLSEREALIDRVRRLEERLGDR